MYEIVRPFETRTPQSTKRIIATNAKVDVTPALMSWGAAGTVAQPYELPSTEEPIEFTVKKHTDWREPAPQMRRETERVRVENPDDPNQYVMVERVKSISFETKASRQKKSKGFTATESNPDNIGADPRKTSVSYSELPVDPAMRSIDSDGNETVRYYINPPGQ